MDVTNVTCSHLMHLVFSAATVEEWISDNWISLEGNDSSGIPPGSTSVTACLASWIGSTAPTPNSGRPSSTSATPCSPASPLWPRASQMHRRRASDDLWPLHFLPLDFWPQFSVDLNLLLFYWLFYSSKPDNCLQTEIHTPTPTSRDVALYQRLTISVWPQQHVGWFISCWFPGIWKRCLWMLILLWMWRPWRRWRTTSTARKRNADGFIIMFLYILRFRCICSIISFEWLFPAKLDSMRLLVSLQEGLAWLGVMHLGRSLNGCEESDWLCSLHPTFLNTMNKLISFGYEDILVGMFMLT